MLTEFPGPPAYIPSLHRLIDATMFRVLPMEDNAKTGIVDFELEPTIDITHG